MSRTTLHHPRFVAVALLVVVSLFLSACGSDSDGTDGANGGDGDSSDSVDSLTIAAGGTGAYFMPIYLADAMGYTDDVGLDLTIDDVGANVSTSVVSGQGDLGAIGVGSSFGPVEEGKDIVTVVVVQLAVANGFVVGREDITSLDQCTKLAASAIGSAGFSIASLFQDAVDDAFEIKQFGDPTQIVPSTLGGATDCALSSLATLAPSLDQGLHLIVDPRDPSTLPTDLVANAAGGGLWGVKEVLEEKRDAVVKLMKAIQMTQDDLSGSSAAELATALHELPYLQTFTLEELTGQVEDALPFALPNGGRVDEDTWPDTLGLYAYSFPFIDPEDSKWSYDSRVDMSYYDEAADE